VERKDTRLLVAKSQQGPDGLTTVEEDVVEEVTVEEAVVEEVAVEEESSKASVTNATSGATKPRTARQQATEVQLATASAQRKVLL